MLKEVCGYIPPGQNSGGAFASMAGWLVVVFLTSQQHGCVSQGQICSVNCPCRHTEIEGADQLFYLIQSQYTGIDGADQPFYLIQSQYTEIEGADQPFYLIQSQYTEIDGADQPFYLIQSQYTDTSPSADPISPGTWKGSHWSANF